MSSEAFDGAMAALRARQRVSWMWKVVQLEISRRLEKFAGLDS